jgi:diguanylate cyclase (GGDEF)-like protein
LHSLNNFVVAIPWQKWHGGVLLAELSPWETGLMLAKALDKNLSHEASAQILKSLLVDQFGLNEFSVYWKIPSFMHFQPFPSLTPFRFSSQEMHTFQIELQKRSILQINHAQRTFSIICLKTELETEFLFFFPMISDFFLQSEKFRLLLHLWVNAWEKRSLQNEIQDTREQLQKIRSMSEQLTKPHALKSMLSLILKAAIDLVHAERGFIMLLDESNNQLVLEIVHGLPNPEAEDMINRGLIPTAGIRPGEGIQGKVLQTRQPIKIHEISDYRMMGLEEGIQSIMCVPLCLNDDAFGVIYVTNKKDNRLFSDQDLDVLSILAGNVATVIDQARLFKITVTDHLTGLFTRRFFEPQLHNEIKRALRFGHSLALLALDADHFKDVNDTYGHQAGDLVLKAIAATIQGNLRKNIDVAARLGGEEFFCFLPETSPEGAWIVAERIRKHISTMVIPFEQHNITITMSIGIACFPHDSQKADELIKAADEALYQSKHNGRNRVSAFNNPNPTKSS